jgi:presenilin-like A22 family membrane protease
MYRSFVTNNFLVVLGVFAAAMVWAGSYQINFLLILIGLFALYDLAGVFWWKVLPQVAKNAAKTGIPLLLLVPKKGVSWLHPPMPETTASMLGAGDLFFPLLFLSAVSVQVGYWVALVSLAGALVGNVGNIFWAWKIKKGIPAIPLLAIGLAVGYWLGLLFFLAK